VLPGLLDRLVLPGLLDRPAEALEAARFPFENLDVLEVIHRDNNIDFHID
jgi:hypothetical protein